MGSRFKATATLLAAFAYCLASATQQPDPYVSFEWLAGYKPATLVTDFAAIDLDQKVIEEALELRRLNAARFVYEKGGHSKSVARLKLRGMGTPTVNPIPSGTEVMGWSRDGKPIRGILLKPLSWFFEDESVEIIVQYQVHVAQEDHGRCHVGGLVAQNEATQTGCFEESGVVRIIDFQHGDSGHQFNYTYDVLRDNINEHSIRRFSSRAIGEMASCDTCPYPMFQKYTDYYGTPVYADRWVRSLFQGAQTDFKHGNSVQHEYNEFTRSAGIKEATKVLNMWMYVIHLLEDSITQCNRPCNGDKCDPISHLHQWDKAVALYVGSMQGESGAGNGNLLYNFADRMCAHFRTCGDQSQYDSGTATVNLQMIHEFGRGQGMITRRDCHSARMVKDRISRLMIIPLVQSTLHMAYTRNYYPAATKQYSRRDHVKGAVYAASVLPLIHECSEDDAEIIYKNLGLGKKSLAESHVDFRAVKAALEKNYECMGIRCSEVGGVWDQGDYGHYASPCMESQKVSKHNSGMMNFVVGICIFTLCVLVMLFALGYRGRRRKVPRLIGIPTNSPPNFVDRASHGFT